MDGIRYRALGILGLFLFFCAKQVSATPYYWEFQGNFTWPSGSAQQTCNAYFDWYANYYEPSGGKVSNRRVVDHSTYPNTIKYCKYDLSVPWGDYPDQTGQANRRGQGCGPSFQFNAVTGMCEAYCDSDETWDAANSSCEAPPSDDGKCSESSHPINFLEGEKFRDEPVLSIGNQFPVELVFHYNSHVGRELSAGRFGISQATVLLGRAQLVEQRPPMSQDEWAQKYSVSFEAVNDKREFAQQYWRHNYAHVLKIEGGKRTWFRPRGKPVRFDASGTGQSSVYPHLWLQGVEGLWKLTDTQAGLHYYFDSTGNLVELKNYKLGVSHVLSYSADGADLLKIEHSLGGALTFSYQAKKTDPSGFTPQPGGIFINFVSQVSDSAGRKVDVSWNHEYKGRAQTYHLITSISHPYVDAPKGKRDYEYNDGNYQTALTAIYEQPTADVSGRQLYAEFRYDDRGRAIYSALANGVDARTVEYPDSFTRVVINALGKPSTYRYTKLDGVRRLQSVTGEPTAACAQSNFSLAYNSAGQVVERNQNGQVTSYTYHPTRGLRTKVVHGFGTPEARTTETQWHNTFDLPVKVIEAEKVTTYTYTNTGLVESITESAGGQSRTTRYAYNADSQLVRIDGPREDVEDVTLLTYDVQRNLASVTNALGHVTQFDLYDEQGRAGLITDTNGVQTRLAYHPRGWLTASSRLHPSGDPSKTLTTHYGYSGLGLLASVTLPDGQETRYEYDSARRLAVVVNHLGERYEISRDAAGNITQEVIKDVSLQTVYSVTRSFDELSRLRELLTGEGQSASYGYDVNDNLTAVTDGRNATTTYDFDALNQLKAEVDPLLNPTGYSYNASGQLSAVTDPAGLITQYEYNGFGQLVQQTSPDTGVTTFDYDEADNRILRTDARGVQTRYHYDALNRLTLVEYPSNSALNQTYVYDQPGAYTLGRLTQTRDVSGVAHYRYDYLGNLVAKHYTVDEGAYALQFAYDDVGRLSTMTYPSGRLVNYSYDALGRIVAVTTQANAQAAAVTVVNQVAYQPFGPVAGWTYGNGLQHQRSYDLDYRLQNQRSLGVTLASDASYSYDGNSNIKAIDALLDPAKSQAFVYDALNRLTAATGHYGELGYTYDPVGNRLSRSHNQQQDLYHYAPDSHQLTAITPAASVERSFGYDDNGNLITDSRAGGLQWQYDAQNRPEYVQVGGQQISYLHNLLGQRVLKQTESGTQVFHYGLDGKLLAASNQFGATTEEHLWLGDIKVGSLLGSGNPAGYADLYVLAPANDSHLFYGEGLAVSASATDGGQDVSGSIAWASDRDGALGTGAAPVLNGLSLGTHRITAEVVSAAGKVTRQQRLVRVTQNATPELVLERPGAETYVVSAGPLILQASALDAEDGDLSASIHWSSSLTGSLGQGASLNVNLPQGRHLLTATVVDSFGLSAQRSVVYHWVDGSDSDQDGLPDDWEVNYFGDLGQQGSDDADGDEISNIQEYANRSHPLVATPVNALDPQKTGASLSLSENNSTIDNQTNNWRSAIALAPLVAGRKYYWEAEVTRATGYAMVGIASDAPLNSYIGSTNGSYGWHNNGGGRLYHKNAYQSFTNYSFGDRLMVAYDASAGKLWFGKNGVWQGNPVAGTGAQFSNVQGLQYPAISAQNTGVSLKFRPSSLHYAIPEGFEVSRVVDADFDGLEDDWEHLHFGHLNHIGTDDPDADGMDNLAEQRYGGNPNDGLADGDQDGLPDLWEIQYFDTLAHGGDDDVDHDGQTNAQEFQAGTDPTVNPSLNHLNPANKAAALTLSNNNTTAEHTGSNWLSAIAVGALPAGKKYYWEAEVTRATGYAMVGIGRDTPLTNYLGSTVGSYGWHNNASGRKYNAGSFGWFTNYTVGDRLMLAYDAVNGKLWFGKNGVWQGDPVTGSGAQFSNIQGLQYPAVSAINVGVTLIFNPNNFVYSAPSGYVPSAAQ